MVKNFFGQRGRGGPGRNGAVVLHRRVKDGVEGGIIVILTADLVEKTGGVQEGMVFPTIGKRSGWLPLARAQGAAAKQKAKRRKAGFGWLSHRTVLPRLLRAGDWHERG